jgi:glycosyltransferase involved in cell wall biosynthesis
MQISVIVPVYNSGATLEEVLGALKTAALHDTEIIVVDDGSTDGSATVAERMGVRVFRLPRNSGVSAARNYGARQAQGDILFFVDADVIVAPGMVNRVARFFEEHPKIAAVFGSYDAVPRAPGLVSRYRNLLHHFVHQNGNPEASTFWGACGAIRRSVFNAVGGFDEQRFRRPSIEDIELGYRLRETGHRIALDKGLQGTHLKRWTLGSIIKTDIFCRAIPWARLILERKNAPNDLNLKRTQRFSGSLVMLACPLVPLGLLHVEFLAFPVSAVLGVTFLNRDLYAFFFRKHGFRFAATGMLLHLLYYLYSSLSYVFVWLTLRLKIVSKSRPYSSYS